MVYNGAGLIRRPNARRRTAREPWFLVRRRVQTALTALKTDSAYWCVEGLSNGNVDLPLLRPKGYGKASAGGFEHSCGCGRPLPGRSMGLLLAFVAIGIYPRLTALAHWWVSFSVWNAVTITDGGDQITLVLSTLLLPLALTDSRMWHWSQTTSVRPTRFGVLLARVIGQSSLGLIRWQLFIVYLDACLSKLAIPEWRDGTAMYYWLNDNYMGLPGYMHGLFEPLLSSKWVALITWSVLLLEFCLAISILMKPRIRLYLFPLALAFHMGIALFMGITSFAVAMIAALLLFMVPVGMDLGALLSWYRAARSFRLSDSAVEAS